MGKILGKSLKDQSLSPEETRKGKQHRLMLFRSYNNAQGSPRHMFTMFVPHILGI